MKDYETQTYTLKNTKWVENAVSLSDKEAGKDLLICFLTIKDIRNLLFDPDVNLAYDISDEFIRKILIVDFSLIIRTLLNYTGNNRKAVDKTSKLMNDALNKLYSASMTYIETDSYRYIDSRIKALLYCRDRLQQAYLQLEYLSELVQDLSQIKEITEGSASSNSPLEYSDKEKPGGPNLEFEIGPPVNKHPEKYVGNSSDEVSFTAFYPREGKVDTWHTLLVYAHLLSAIKEVYQDAKRFNDQLPLPKEISSSSPAQIAPGTEITIVPACNGILFNPKRQNVEWMEDYHRAYFRFRADKSVLNTETNGYITIFIGPLIVGTLRFTMSVNNRDEVSLLKHEEHSTMYRKDKIFISYSHKDTDLVLTFKKVHEATGYDVLIDIDDLRSGQEWNIELMRMIDRADIFQLFWSENSKKSKYCKQEWEHALRRASEGFIRPVYWHQPLPNPPKELRKFHFEYVEL